MNFFKFLLRLKIFLKTLKSDRNFFWFLDFGYFGYFYHNIPYHTQEFSG